MRQLTSKAIVLSEADNVATALVDLAEGEVIEVQMGLRTMAVKIAEPVPFGHKVALVDIPAGASILKYGESIGMARRDIPAGGYVHVHNVESQRGRGDLVNQS